MSFKRKLNMGCFMLVAGIATAGPVLAQEVPASNEVIVTATKRATNVQDIPAAVTALSGAQLQDRGIANVEQLAVAVPNLTFGSHAGASFVTIRGVGSTINSGVTETTVASYVDGLYLPRATMGILQQVDLDRVEVLRGPQGTLYGRNATGGAVNFISKAPTETFTGEANAWGGSRNRLGASGVFSGPISDNLLFRVSGGYTKADSYVENVVTGPWDTSVGYARGALRYTPKYNLTIDLSVKYEKQDGADTVQQLFTLPTNLPPSTGTTAVNKTQADYPFSLKNETLISNLTLNWKISNDVAFRSVSGYINHRSTTSFDGDTTSLPVQVAVNFVRPSKTLSQEFVLFGDTGKLEWLTGLFLYHENFQNNLPVLLPLGGGPGIPAGSTVSLNLKDESTDSFAAFTDLTWKFTDRLRGIVGVRYNAERKAFDFSTGLIIPSAGFFGVSEQSEIATYRFLPKVGLQYDLTNSANVYVQYQQGSKSGGHDIALPRTFGGEVLDAYEAGVKSSWLDGALTANGSVFFYQYDGLQITNNTGPTTTQVENADAEVKGAEAEFVWKARENVDLNLALTYLDSEYTNFTSFDAARPLLGPINLRGVQLLQAPKYTVRAGGSWRIPLNAGLLSDVVLRADVMHTDDVILRYFATANDVQKAYTLANLSATLNDKANTTALRVFVTNVGDVDYKRMIDYLGGPGSYDGNYGEPRTWGVQLTRRF